MFPGVVGGDLTAAIPDPLNIGVAVTYECPDPLLFVNGELTNQCDDQGEYVNAAPSCDESK